MWLSNNFEAKGRRESGFTMVEILSQCPTNWAMNPVESVEWLEGNMIPFYQLGELKNELSTAQGGAK